MIDSLISTLFIFYARKWDNCKIYQYSVKVSLCIDRVSARIFSSLQWIVSIDRFKQMKRTRRTEQMWRERRELMELKRESFKFGQQRARNSQIIAVKITSIHYSLYLAEARLRLSYHISQFWRRRTHIFASRFSHLTTIFGWNNEFNKLSKFTVRNAINLDQHRKTSHCWTTLEGNASIKKISAAA